MAQSNNALARKYRTAGRVLALIENGEVSATKGVAVVEHIILPTVFLVTSLIMVDVCLVYIFVRERRH